MGKILKFRSVGWIAAFWCAWLWTSAVLAANCGADDCGDHGSCRLSSLLPRCDCDEGYFSVSTFVAPSSLGAYCVPMPAPPSEQACADTDCGANGVCVVREREGGAAQAECHCDLGYRADGQGHCVDDPADDAERACLAVDCGANIVCMATSDAVTCRCTGGGQVVLGGGADGGFGPVCSTPPDPATACGPDACGPLGSCVISQAIFCDCDEGSTQMDATGPDGKPHPYCVRPGEPVPIGDGGSAHDAGTVDAAVIPAAEAGIGLPGPDYVAKGGGCQLTHAPDIFHGQVLWEMVVLGAFWARRRKGSATQQSRCSN